MKQIAYGMVGEVLVRSSVMSTAKRSGWMDSPF